MKKETKEKHFIKKPEYIGGIKAMRKFIQENMKYPKDALENKIEGTVAIDYKVDNNGKVVKAKVISGLGHGCDEEALRLVNLFKFTAPRNRKVRATFNKKIQIHFRLPKKREPQHTIGTEVQYNYITIQKSAKEKPAKKKKSRTYTFTINY